MHMHTNTGITVFTNNGPLEVPSHSLKYQLMVNEINGENRTNVLEDIASQSENATVADFSSGRVEYSQGKITAKGIEVPESIISRVRRIVESGITNIKPWVMFLDKLIDNPSRASVESLYDWLEYQGLPLAQDGDVLGYKSVDQDYYSHTAGNTPLIQGMTNENGNILNMVGTTIEMARNQVDDNRDHGCSYGLHIGNYDYARSFGGEDRSRLLVVKFNPANAVSVPHCSSHQKLRVACYSVVQDITANKTFLKEPLYNIENGELHAQSVDSEKRIIQRIHEEYPDHMGFIDTANYWRTTPDKLIRILHKHGYKVDWSDPQNPTIDVDIEECSKDPYHDLNSEYPYPSN